MDQFINEVEKLKRSIINRECELLLTYLRDVKSYPIEIPVDIYQFSVLQNECVIDGGVLELEDAMEVELLRKFLQDKMDYGSSQVPIPEPIPEPDLLPETVPQRTAVVSGDVSAMSGDVSGAPDESVSLVEYEYEYMLASRNQ